MPSLQYRAILVTVQIINPSTGKYAAGTARVDSGADITLIDSSVITAINDPSSGSTMVQGITGSPTNTYEYIVGINLGRYGYIPQIKVGTIDGLASRDGYVALIGTDALSTGLFDYDGLTQQFNMQLGISQGPPISPIPPWVLPLGIAGVAVGLAGILYLLTR